jgi:uncharacterized protein
MSKTEKFEIYKDAAGQYRWRLRAANGETVAVSEAYRSKQGANNSAHSMPRWCSETPVVDFTNE